MADHVLIIISDRPSVWQGYRAENRAVRRWLGEHAGNQPQRDQGGFAGDPTTPATYQGVCEGSSLCAVVDMHAPERARAAIEALRSVRPEAAVLVITSDRDAPVGDLALSRRLEWTDALRGDLDAELKQLELQRCVHNLRAFAVDVANLPILVHPDPDPDALASALAVRALLRRGPDETPIVTLGEMTRPENRRMAELLGMRVTEVTEAELRKFDRVIAVDHQPVWLAEGRAQCIAVIDHHPVEHKIDYGLSDLRPDYGATATLLTEYMYADDARRIDEKLATALLYGIKTDTDSLARGGNGADVKAYAYLLGQADVPLLRRLERPSYALDSARAYGRAISQLGTSGDVAVAFLGKLDPDDTHILVDVADFCLSLEEITWSAAAGIIDDQLVFTLRNLGGAKGAGQLAKLIAGSQGSGGGHATMARARVPLNGDWKELAVADFATGTQILLNRLSAAIETLRANPRSSHPAHPVTNRPVPSR